MNTKQGPAWIAGLLALSIATASAALQAQTTSAEAMAPSAETTTDVPATAEASGGMMGGHRSTLGGKGHMMHSQGGGGMMHGGHGGHGGGMKSAATGKPGRHGMKREKMMRHHENMEARLRNIEEQLNVLHAKVDQLLRRR